MANGYLHGVYSREVPTELLPARVVDTNVIFAVGTAPVDTLPANKKRFINEPRLYYSYTEFVAEMGWSEDWNAYTLCEVAESHFAKYGAAPIVAVNVFDPAVHLSSEDENAQPSPLAVTSADIIGGIDANLRKTGLELIAEVFPRYRLVPGCILAPKFSEDPAVAISMGAKAKDINGLFQAMAAVDVPTDKVPLYTEVPGYKTRNNLTGENMIVCWPRIALGERTYHLSTQLAGLMSLTDSDAGGTPQVSPSNKRLYMDGAVALSTDGGANGTATELWLDLEACNYLNGQGIVTATSFEGWKAWGNRTGCYPDVTDPKDAFIPIRRFFNWYRNTFILTYFQKVDAPITKRLLRTILKSEQIRLDGLTSREVINGGRISFLETENANTEIMDGLLRFHLWISPPPPARVIEGIFEFDPTYLQNLFGDE